MTENMAQPIIGRSKDRSPAGTWRRRFQRVATRHLGPITLLGTLGYLVVLPLVRLQQKALENGAEAYDELFDIPTLGKTLLTTAQLAIGSMLIALLFGTGLAWASMKLPRRWEWLGVLPMLPIVLPPVANIIGWAMMLNPRVGFVNQWLRKLPMWSGNFNGPIDIFTKTWITIVTGLALTSFVYVFVRSGLRRLNQELIEAAQVAGASPLRAFVGIVVPMLRPSFIYGGSVALLLGLGQFTAPLLLGTRNGVSVLTTELYTYATSELQDFGLSAAFGSPLLFAGIVLVFAQRFMLANPGRFATDIGKGTRSVGRTSKWAALVVGLFGLFSVLTPLFALMVVSVSPFWSGKIEPAKFTWSNYRTVFSDPGLTGAIRTSLLVSVLAVCIALPLGYLIADLVFRKRGAPVVRWLIDLIVNLPLGVPAVIFGAGFFITYTQRPLVLYGTYWVMVIVYVVIMLPFTVRLQLAARMTLGNSYEQASRVSGAGPIRTHLSIVLPLIRSSLSGAAALMFVLLTHEFAASLLVRSARVQTMGTVVYERWTTSSYSVVAAVSLIMCVVTTAGLVLAVKLGGKSGTLDQL
jgi:iron(III) transport system permease protein